MAFRDQITTLYPHTRFINASGGAGMTAATGRTLDALLSDCEDVTAVYSMGGGNSTILRKLAERRLHPTVYVAHDLDRENRYLLAQGAISYVLTHDLSQDLLHLFSMVCDPTYADLSDEAKGSSAINVITPYNL